MPRDGITLKLEGATELTRLLRATPKAITEKAVKEASAGAMRPVSTYAKRLLRGNKGEMPWSLGLLEKSIGVKTKVYTRGKNAGTIWVGVGPRSGFRTSVARPRVYGADASGGMRSSVGSVDIRVADPVRYAHLVEMGTKRSRAFPFMRRAYATKGRQVPAEVARRVKLKVPQIIQREARRAGMRRR